MESLFPEPIYIAAGTIAMLLVAFTWYRLQNLKRYPPGPPRSFLVGNLKDIPSGGNEWEAYIALGKKLSEWSANEFVGSVEPNYHHLVNL